MNKDDRPLVFSIIAISISLIVLHNSAFADVLESERGEILIDISSNSPEIFIDGLDTTIIRQSIHGDHGRILGEINDNGATFYMVYDISDKSVKVKFWNYDTKTIFDTLTIHSTL